MKDPLYEALMKDMKKWSAITGFVGVLSIAILAIHDWITAIMVYVAIISIIASFKIDDMIRELKKADIDVENN